MSTPLIRPHVEADIDGDILNVDGGSVKLDARAVPYAAGDLVLPFLSDAQLAFLNPGDGVRIPFEFGETGGASRACDMGLRRIRVDHVAKTVTLNVASDEALLQDRSTLTVDTGARAHEASARGVVEYVLGLIPSITRNLFTAPRGTSTTGFVGSVGGGTAPTLSTPSTPGMNVGGVEGLDTFLRGEAVGAGTYIDIRNATTQPILVSPGEVVTGSAYVRPSTISGVSGAAFLQFVNAGGTVLATSTAPFALTSNAWTRINVTGTAPATTARVVVIFRAIGGVVLGSRLDVTGMLVEKTARLSPYKDMILVAGPDDADVTAYWALTNLITNPSAEVNTAGWATGTGTSAVTRVTGVAPTTPAASASFRWTASGTGQSFLSGSVSSPVTQGHAYIFSGYVLGTAPVRSIQPMVRFTNASGETLREYYGTAFTASTSAWQRFVHPVVAPQGATLAVMHLRSVTNTAGQFHFADALMFHEGTEAVEYLDGATPDTAEYTFDWDGDTAHASPSTRTPVVERLPELFSWKPGVTAWDFLLGIITSAGLVLWCDEQRRWFLALAENRTVPGLLSITEGNTRDGEDSIDRDDVEARVTGVVIRYRWRDDDGLDHEQFDTAGTPDKVVTIDLATAYPGPGAAAAALARRSGSGRAQSVTAVWQLTTNPGMTAALSLPGAPDTIGRVADVEFLFESGFMNLGTAGLVDIIPGSIAALVGTIDSLVGTIDSL